MRNNRWIVLAAFALLVAGCLQDDDRFADAATGYPADAAEIVSGVDWTKAEKFTVTLLEFEFAPDALSFIGGRPYALTLVNGGAFPHVFAAERFFRAIAAKSLVYQDGEASLPALESILLNPEESKTLLFVPVTPGRYKLTCTQPLHATFGMVGQIRIE